MMRVLFLCLMVSLEFLVYELYEWGHVNMLVVGLAGSSGNTNSYGVWLCCVVSCLGFILSGRWRLVVGRRFMLWGMGLRRS